jgi:hypothetical protein
MVAPWWESKSIPARDDDEFHDVLALAAAVVRRAYQDLTTLREREADTIRRDAYDFLVNRLWEPDSIWYEILHSFLAKKDVLEVVHRYVTLCHGSVIVMPI